MFARSTNLSKVRRLRHWLGGPHNPGSCLSHAFRGASLLGTVLCLALGSGCGTAEGEFPRIVNEPAPLAADVRAGFGRVGILPPNATERLHLWQPVVPGDVAQKLSDRNFAEIQRALHSKDPEADDKTVRMPFEGLIAAGPATLATLAPGVPEQELLRAQETLRGALNEVPLVSALQRELAHVLADPVATNVVLLPEDAVGEIATRGFRPDFAPLAGRGIDSVLDIRVQEVGFEYQPVLWREMFFTPQLVVYLIRIRDGRILHASPLDYRGSRHTLMEWADRDAAAFRIEIGLAARAFVESLMDEYFDANVRDRHGPPKAE